MTQFDYLNSIQISISMLQILFFQMSKPFHQLTNSELDHLHNTDFPKWQIAMRIRKNYRDALAKRQAITANRQARIAKRDALQGKFKEAYNYKLMSLNII